MTEVGKKDIENISKFILANICSAEKRAGIYSSNVRQVYETAELLSGATGLPWHVDENLRNLHVGVFDGLADDEVNSKYPDAARRLALWRQGKLDVNEIGIPEAETMRDFLDRIRLALQPILCSDLDVAVVVVSRSVGIAIINILLENTYLRDKPYTRYRLDPGSITLLEVSQPHGARLTFDNRSDFLNRAMNYPDD